MNTTTFRAKLLRRIGTTGTLLLGTLALQLGAQTFPNGQAASPTMQGRPNGPEAKPTETKLET